MALYAKVRSLCSSQSTVKNTLKKFGLLLKRPLEVCIERHISIAKLKGTFSFGGKNNYCWGVRVETDA